MMNFALSPFLEVLKLLDREITHCLQRGSTASALIPIPDDDKERLQQNLRFVSDTCRRLSLQGADNRLDRISTAFRGSDLAYLVLAQELVTLKEAIEDDIQYERFYHYPHVLGETVLNVQADWAPTIKAFPPALPEVQSGVDCYALGQPTAAIFHFMRAAEYGLRALARERRVRLPKNKPIEWATWNEIILQIESAAKKFGQKRAGPKKDAALDFYSGALAHFNGFKDQYRNMVMHVRKVYEPWESEMAMRQVRDFMNKLSAKVGETTRGPIKWGL